jgi:hypothetical protein
MLDRAHLGTKPAQAPSGIVDVLAWCIPPRHPVRSDVSPRGTAFFLALPFRPADIPATIRVRPRWRRTGERRRLVSRRAGDFLPPWFQNARPTGEFAF